MKLCNWKIDPEVNLDELLLAQFRVSPDFLPVILFKFAIITIAFLLHICVGCVYVVVPLMSF